MTRYYNTNKERLSTIKKLVDASSEYDAFKIRFESPIGDVLYLRRVDTHRYKRYMPISNLFALNVSQL